MTPLAPSTAALVASSRLGPGSARSSDEDLHVTHTLIATSMISGGSAACAPSASLSISSSFQRPYQSDRELCRIAQASDLAGLLSVRCTPPRRLKNTASDGRSPDLRVVACCAAFPGGPSGFGQGYPLTVAGAAPDLDEPHRLPFSPSLAGRTIAAD